MKRIRFRISAGGVLLLAALYFTLDLSEFVALMLAVCIHESGHLAAIALTGGHIDMVSANAAGAVISQRQGPERGAELLRAAAGPAAGVLYAWAASELGGALNSRMLLCSSGFSLVLSAYNALPVLPLDGGRMLACIAGERAASLCSLITAGLVMLLGAAAAAAGYGFALLMASVLLMLQQTGL